MQEQTPYNEPDFVEYALKQMDIKILKRENKFFELENGFSIEVEATNLYKLSSEGWVISPFEDIGSLCDFIKKNLQAVINNE